MLKTLLTRLPHQRAVGLYLDGSEAVLSRIALTTLGTVEIENRVESLVGQNLETVLPRLFLPWLTDRSWRSAPIVLGLPPLSVFFSTRPIKTLNRDATPQTLLHEVLRSSSLNIDDMEVDMVQRLTGKQMVAGLLACRKKVLSPILKTLNELGVKPFQVEPGPCGLLRLAVAQHRSPRKARTVLRIFLGATSALAVLTSDNFPLLWRTTELTAGDEPRSLLSLYRGVEKLARFAGAEAGPSAVMIHGRPELSGLENSSEWASIKVPVSRYQGPSLTTTDIVLGLALGGHSEVESFNLARAARPTVPLLSLVPWGQLVVQAALLVSGAMYFSSQLADLESMQSTLGAERSALTWLKDQPVAALKAENTELKTRIDVVRDYLSHRILWASCTREVVERLSPEMTLSNLAGQCEYKPDNAGRESGTASRSSLTMAIDAPIASGGSIPPEIEGLLDALRASPLKKDLPTIELGTLRWNSSAVDKVATASFTVLCLPKVEAVVARPTPAKPPAKP